MPPRNNNTEVQFEICVDGQWHPFSGFGTGDIELERIPWWRHWQPPVPVSWWRRLPRFVLRVLKGGRDG